MELEIFYPKYFKFNYKIKHVFIVNDLVAET